MAPTEPPCPIGAATCAGATEVDWDADAQPSTTSDSITPLARGIMGEATTGQRNTDAANLLAPAADGASGRCHEWVTGAPNACPAGITHQSREIRPCHSIAALVLPESKDRATACIMLCNFAAQPPRQTRRSWSSKLRSHVRQLASISAGLASPLAKVMSISLKRPCGSSKEACSNAPAGAEGLGLLQPLRRPPQDTSTGKSSSSIGRQAAVPEVGVSIATAGAHGHEYALPTNALEFGL